MRGMFQNHCLTACPVTANNTSLSCHTRVVNNNTPPSFAIRYTIATLSAITNTRQITSIIPDTAGQTHYASLLSPPESCSNRGSVTTYIQSFSTFLFDFRLRNTSFIFLSSNHYLRLSRGRKNSLSCSSDGRSRRRRCKATTFNSRTQSV